MLYALTKGSVSCHQAIALLIEIALPNGVRSETTTCSQSGVGTGTFTENNERVGSEPTSSFFFFPSSWKHRIFIGTQAGRMLFTLKTF